MGLASLFRKKTNYFRTSIEPQCAYCQYGMRGKSEDNTMIYCEKKGPMKENDSCKKFSYSPLKRIPVKQLNIEGSDSNELYVEISEEELAAKQAAAAKADAAEKAHAEKAASAARAQEEAAAKAAAEAEARARAEAEAQAKAAAEAKARAEAEAQARAAAEAKAKAEAEARAKAEAEARARAEAEARARAEAQAKAKAAAPPNDLDEIAKAAEEAARIGVPTTPAPAAAPAPAPAPAPAFQTNSAAGIDDEFADLDDVEGADVIEVEEHEEVMKSKKSTLVAESTQHRGPVPNLPSASAFLRDGKKKPGSSSSGTRRQAPPPPTAMMQAPKKSNTDNK